jgi:plastocyanin
MREKTLARYLLAIVILFALCAWHEAALATTQSGVGAVTAKVDVREGAAGSENSKLARASDASGVVVWLKPLDVAAPPPQADPPSHSRPQMAQHNKQFEPHLLVVQAGTLVDFPNRDPFFHNVFSLFDGKRFDLGLYEAGATNSARFDRVGVSYLFCNIHPEMSAVVVAVDSTYFAVSDASGAVNIANVPPGRYEMHVWYERSLPEDLKDLTRVVRISDSAHDLGAISVIANPNFTSAHKNKYGQDYVPPPSSDYGNP